ncbi:guanine nucleotide-binding protein subunit gamma 3-like isoform X2 [Tripterygium wilfordii]|uniref:guanine nucleotide-binding protein subunit gamma 3-like isoform X2 n=1 Tax=Tripterygium wilfordii TaxID=458696 RepID=UPI0018F80D72|nr:guanine nucleotide-binding protein subunit gamma 3-like isoform X2 [Tripterygium wilfordii]
MATPPGSSSSLPSLPPPRPKSPPKYPDLYGKRRETAKVQMLEREIGFLEEELKSIDGLQPASRCCKDVTDFVVANSDPLIPIRKKRKSCRIWKWLCGLPCFNFSWICCCCCNSGCPLRLEMPHCCCRCHCRCCNFNICKCCSCNTCSLPKLRWCCVCPRFNCCREISCCCSSLECPSPSCPDCSSCCRWVCCRPRCPKVRSCNCTKTCWNPCWNPCCLCI